MYHARIPPFAAPRLADQLPGRFRGENGSTAVAFGRAGPSEEVIAMGSFARLLVPRSVRPLTEAASCGMVSRDLRNEDVAAG
jgi:hypothetical protein